MLSDFNLQMVKEVEKQFNLSFKSFNLNKNIIKNLFKNYQSEEITIDFYDSSPPQCEECEELNCENCEIYEAWFKSEERLKFNNWIDVFGPDIWDYNQEDSDKFARNLLLEVLKDKEKNDRLFIAYKDNSLILYYYNRDRKECCDYGFVFEKRED